MELLQSLELTNIIWDITNEVVASKIKCRQIPDVDYAFTIKCSLQMVVRERQVLKQGSIEEFIRECPNEVVVASLEHSQHGAVTKPWGDCATELVVG